MQKMLRRGTSPPLDPKSELALLHAYGLGDRLVNAPYVGDISKRLLDPPESVDDLDRRSSPQFTPDPALQFDSPYEWQFLSWVNEQLGPSAARRFTPQAGLENLTSGDPGGARRVDFLVSAPLIDPFVVEIDDDGHVAAIDEERDRELTDSGFGVVRVPVSEVETGSGPNLTAVLDRCASLDRDGDGLDPLHLDAAQVHRVALGVLEAVKIGCLSGTKWAIGLEGKALAPSLLQPVLSTFLALDTLWGGDLMPKEISIVGEDALLLRASGARYVIRQSNAGRSTDAPDVSIVLQPDLAPTEKLPAIAASIPQIVVRSAHLPVRLRLPVADETRRIALTPDDSSGDALRIILRSVFAKADFREGQLEAVIQILRGLNCTVLLPTGAGKSLIYQLASLCLPGRTLVIDPLVSLMEDQVERLGVQGIDRVAMITAYTVTQGAAAAVLQQIGEGDALFVFVSPERLQQRSFRNALRQLSVSSHVNLAVIDEARCVSEWGHDFRPAYLDLGGTLQRECADGLGVAPPLLALTGTASRSVLKDVLAELAIDQNDPNAVVKPVSFDRPELRFHVLRTDGNFGSIAKLKGFMQRLPDLAGIDAASFFRPRGSRTAAGIVFCPHVNGDFGVVAVAEELSPIVGTHPLIYSGSTPRGFTAQQWERQKRQNAAAFKGDQGPIIVSTKAFGMGIDKPNVRYVVHLGIPSSIEAYYQEAGRAGRDGQASHCGIVFSEFDPGRTASLLDEDSPLEDARAELSQLGRHDADDVTRQLFFFFKSFKGHEAELDQIRSILEELTPFGRARTVIVPMGDGSDREDRQRAIYRLTILGIVKEYLADWGPKTFEVILSGISSGEVGEHLLRYVRRTQPARATVLAGQLSGFAELSLEVAAPSGAELLIGFVYDTVVRSRRRALREMCLATRESASDADEKLRRRILAYLTEGDIAPTLERLLSSETLSIRQWTQLLDEIESGPDGRELQGAAARLLASTPDHPGLLLARGVSEILAEEPNAREYEGDVRAAIDFARSAYRIHEDELDHLGEWLLALASKQDRSDIAAATLGVLTETRVAPAIVWSETVRASERFATDPSIAVLVLTATLERARSSLDNLAASR